MTLLLRFSLLGVALSALMPGLEGTLGPSSFYASFPLGRGWVELLPPYNEHLIRDVGALHLALALLTAAAAARPRPASARLAGAAWLVFSVPHLLYHAGHLPPAPVDAVGNLVLLGGTVLLAAAACLPWRPAQVSAGPPSRSSAAGSAHSPARSANRSNS